MNLILDAREKIYKQFRTSSANSSIQGDDFATYYTSMYLIQDTAESVYTHLSRGFSSDSMQAYIEFWGVTQAIFIQQDSISELHRVVVGSLLNIPQGSAWFEIRDKRNLCTGHPANRSHKLPAPQRAFMGRSFGNYDQIKYEVWDANTKSSTHPTFNLRQMIDNYDRQASQMLSDICTHMKKRWP